jgi:lipid-binding SYLF domain-containing protein
MNRLNIKRIWGTSCTSRSVPKAPAGLSGRDKGIPEDMLANEHCIVIVPGLKIAAFVFGGQYGKGYLSCRNKDGDGWSAPGTVRIEGGSRTGVWNG